MTRYVTAEVSATYSHVQKAHMKRETGIGMRLVEPVDSSVLR